ncbi:permease [Candidatus Contubernalis alkaliaceticus]|uniref:permease n=1 Tax=Candidatus Contubernalis alkaliaceticus TaxID=338645 RepID=UPI001F4C3C79|nr:permease [Candidatus Contubernalis alkalaceticus]
MLIYSFLIIGLAVSIYKDRGKTKKAVFIGSRIFIKMLPSLLLIVGLVGLILVFIPPDTIGRYMGTEAGFSGTLLAAVFGAITFIPSIVSIPLAGSLALVGFMAAIFLFIHFLYPPQSVEVYSISLNYLKEMALIIPPVFILMGLFEVWVPKTFIQKYMGKEAGFKGAALAFVFGTIPTGPVYIAFPIAAGMLKKGARIMNINIFLGTWAAAKLPQLLIELKFLGPAFTALRFALTVISVVIIGFLVETLMLKKENQERCATEKG